MSRGDPVPPGPARSRTPPASRSLLGRSAADHAGAAGGVVQAIALQLLLRQPPCRCVAPPVGQPSRGKSRYTVELMRPVTTARPSEEWIAAVGARRQFDSAGMQAGTGGGAGAATSGRTSWGRWMTTSRRRIDGEVQACRSRWTGRPTPRSVLIRLQLPDACPGCRGAAQAPVWRSARCSCSCGWVVGSALFLFAIAALFMRNQVRAIRRLADARPRRLGWAATVAADQVPKVPPRCGRPPPP